MMNPSYQSQGLAFGPLEVPRGGVNPHIIYHDFSNYLSYIIRIAYKNNNLDKKKASLWPHLFADP